MLTDLQRYTIAAFRQRYGHCRPWYGEGPVGVLLRAPASWVIAFAPLSRRPEACRDHVRQWRSVLADCHGVRLADVEHVNPPLEG